MRRFNGPTLDIGILTGWDDVRIFLAVSTSPSFSVAAQLLGTTPSTITRRIAIMEKRARVSLFKRQATGIELTAEGAALVDPARHMAEAAGQFQERLAQLTDEIHGTIRISAGEGLANYVLPHRVAALKRQCPNLIIHIVSHHGASSMINDAADIFVIATVDAYALLKNRDLVARPVGQHHFVPYTHSDHLDKLARTDAPGSPTRLIDLTRCDLVQHVGYREVENFDPWNSLVRQRGRSQSLIEVDSTTGIGQNLETNGGVSLLPSYSRFLRPGMVPLDVSLPPLSLDLIVVASRDRYQSKSVRTTFDFLAGVFNDKPSWFGTVQAGSTPNFKALEPLSS
jgi:DNA-binding transcriptional LysR family regulator